MALPVDIPALLSEATNLEEARKTPLSVSVYIDESAPADLIAHVRKAFASDHAAVRLTLSYLGDNVASVYPTDDMAVIVAGSSEWVGPSASAIRNAGVPCMVCSTQPARVELIAAAANTPIPDGDLIIPSESERTIRKNVGKMVARAIPDQVNSVKKGLTGLAHAAAITEEEAMADPTPLDAAAAEALNMRMGEWIAVVCRQKRLAFALAFPFVRKPLALEAVSETSLQNAGVGLVPLIRAADMPIMTLNQAKMTLQIAAAYGNDLTFERAKEILAVVGGAFGCRAVARKAVTFVPALGTVIGAGVGFAGTEAMGRAVIEYFEGGGNIAGVTRVIEKAATGAGIVYKQTRSKLIEVRDEVNAQTAAQGQA
jgi:uncharacterized protein (DUF697 family)